MAPYERGKRSVDKETLELTDQYTAETKEKSSNGNNHDSETASW
jgi:hypothetical protein